MSQSKEKAQLDASMEVFRDFVKSLTEDSNGYAKMVGTCIDVSENVMRVQNHYIRSLERRIELLEGHQK